MRTVENKLEATKTQVAIDQIQMRLSPQFIDWRRELKDGRVCVRLGLSKTNQSTFGATRIEITYDPKSPYSGESLTRRLFAGTEAGTEERKAGDARGYPVPDKNATQHIEIIDNLRLDITGRDVERWGYMDAQILQANAEIVKYEPKSSIKIDGLPYLTCARVVALCGSDPGANILALEKALAATRFSKTKQGLIVAAYSAEAEARKGDKALTKKLSDFLCKAGETRSNARELATGFKSKLSPYQLFFAKKQSFLKADRFAELYDPVARFADRPLAIVVRQLLDTPHIVNAATDIIGAAWKDFGVEQEAIDDAIARLKTLGIVEEVEKANDKTKFIGLAWLIKTEKAIADVLSRNAECKLAPDQICLVDYVLDNADAMLRKPGFVLTAEQKDAIRATFEHKISVITGPPGVGKTAVIALINAIAAMLWSEIAHPAWVLALSGRAASNAREAGTCWHGHGCIPLHATTIHRAIGLRGEGDDGQEAFEGGSKIACGVLILEEISMDSSPLLDAILRRANFKHLVLVGDPDQLPPIGQGKPFRDILTSSEGALPALPANGTRAIPVTRLNKNWRTDRQGIWALCRGMLAGDPEMMAYASDDYEQAGGVHFVDCERRDRAAEAAKIYAKLARKRGVELDDVAILGPHNQGNEAGIRIANIETRKALKLPADRIVQGDLLLVTKNNYKASSTENQDEIESIYNGERCRVEAVGPDYLDLEFPPNS